MWHAVCQFECVVTVVVFHNRCLRSRSQVTFYYFEVGRCIIFIYKHIIIYNVEPCQTIYDMNSAKIIIYLYNQ